MKKQMTEHHSFENSEVNERQYQQTLKMHQRILQTFLTSYFQCFCVPFYSYDDTIFSQNDSFNNQPEEKENKKYLK